jgi:L-ascorbate metabolism protein UlaG (beta-lactamase superfamily)
MGDTAIFSDMGLVNEIYRPQVGIVPIGDRFTMGARTAALACKRFFQFEKVIPCHYGTFPIIDQTADKFVAEMGGNSMVCLRSAFLSRFDRQPRGEPSC